MQDGVKSAGGVAPMAGAAAVAGVAGLMLSGPMVAVAGAHHGRRCAGQQLLHLCV
jgi:hypothetical protein